MEITNKFVGFGARYLTMKYEVINVLAEILAWTVFTI